MCNRKTVVVEAIRFATREGSVYYAGQLYYGSKVYLCEGSPAEWSDYEPDPNDEPPKYSTGENPINGAQFCLKKDAQVAATKLGQHLWMRGKQTYQRGQSYRKDVRLR